MATNALRQMQGFPFFEKKMRIQFAKVGGINEWPMDWTRLSNPLRCEWPSWAAMGEGGGSCSLPML